MIKKLGMISIILMMVHNCATTRFKADPTVPEDKLALVVPMYIAIIAIDREEFMPNRKFLIGPGKNSYLVMYDDGVNRSTDAKSFEVEAKPGSAIVICSLQRSKQNQFTYSNRIVGGAEWIAFPVLITREKLETYKFGLGYDVLRMQPELCVKEAEVKKLIKKE